MEFEVEVFNDKEKAIVERSLKRIEKTDFSEIRLSLKNIYDSLDRLELLAKFISTSPSLLEEGVFSGRKRTPETLIKTLCNVYNYNIELYVPIKVLIGKDFLIAKVNFFKAIVYTLDYIFRELERDDEVKSLLEAVKSLIANTMYSRLAEEVFLSIIIDRDLDMYIREKTAKYLFNIWEYRVQYGIHEFAPLLESMWDMKLHLKPTYGSLLGISELIKMFMNTHNRRFLEFLLRDDISLEEEEAILEFVFDLSIEEIYRLREYMEKRGLAVISRDEIEKIIGRVYHIEELPDDKKVFVIFENYRKRKLKATYRIISQSKGPKRTAEEYIMIYLIKKYKDRELNDVVL